MGTTPAPTTTGENPCTTYSAIPTTTVPTTTVTTTPLVTTTYTTTPVPTTTPAPTATPAPGPCTTVASLRLYSDKDQSNVQMETNKMAENTVALSTSALPSWFLPICGVFALAAGVSVLSMRRRRARSTRQVQAVQPARQTEDLDSEPLLEEAMLVE